MKKSLISIAIALSLGFSPVFAGNHGSGNNGQGVGNTGPGNQGNDGSNGNAGGGNTGGGNNTGGAATPTEQQESNSRGRNRQNWTPFISTSFILLGFMCDKELSRDDKTPGVTWFCTKGELPDAFESYAQ